MVKEIGPITCKNIDVCYLDNTFATKDEYFPE